jgi:hypothetical protein
MSNVNRFNLGNQMSKKPVAERYADVLLYVEESKPVTVYRNLHNNCLSVKQDGIVRCHAKTGVCLHNATFVVQKGGQARVRLEKVKNVHAFIKGYVTNPRKADNLLPFAWESIYYNPYKVDHFTNNADSKAVKCAEWVDISAVADDWVSQILAFNLGYFSE